MISATLEPQSTEAPAWVPFAVRLVEGTRLNLPREGCELPGEPSLWSLWTLKPINTPSRPGVSRAVWRFLRFFKCSPGLPKSMTPLQPLVEGSLHVVKHVLKGAKEMLGVSLTLSLEIGPRNRDTSAQKERTRLTFFASVLLEFLFLDTNINMNGRFVFGKLFSLCQGFHSNTF